MLVAVLHFVLLLLFSSTSSSRFQTQSLRRRRRIFFASQSGPPVLPFLEASNGDGVQVSWGRRRKRDGRWGRRLSFPSSSFRSEVRSKCSQTNLFFLSMAAAAGRARHTPRFPCPGRKYSPLPPPPFLAQIQIGLPARKTRLHVRRRTEERLLDRLPSVPPSVRTCVNTRLGKVLRLRHTRDQGVTSQPLARDTFYASDRVGWGGGGE